MISTFTAFLDANVFYGARLRSLVLYLAQTKIFRAKWSNDIHEEWIRRLVANRPDLDASRLQRTRELMDAAILDSLVKGYEPIVNALQLPDPRDRHVLAAAIVCNASCIVTFNLDDFPQDTLAPYGIHAIHPDAFLLDVESISPRAFARAVGQDFEHYVQPPLALTDYVTSLAKAGVPKTAVKIERLSVLLTAVQSDGSPGQTV
jgi:predicted nucleic acid-binding protein